MKHLVEFFTLNLTNKLSKEAIIFIISLMPLLELRGSLIAASLLKVPYLKALIIILIGNFLPIPFILLFIEKIIIFLEKFEKTKKISLYFRNKVDKNKSKIEKYGYLSLMLFVGIPLPGTGAWTGSLVAALLHLDFKKSLVAIFLGLIIAAIIISLISYGLIFHFVHN